MAAKKTCTVYEVLVDGPGAGPAGDGTRIHRFRDAKVAEAFAKGQTCYGKPATAEKREGVPRHLAERWGVA